MNLKETTPFGYSYEFRDTTREEGEVLIKKHGGKLMEEYQSFCDVDSSERPYLLTTGQVVEIYTVSAYVYQSIKDYHCSQYNSGYAFESKKILKDGSYQKIEYLPNGEKVFYTRLKKSAGEMLRHVLPPISSDGFPGISSNYDTLFLTENAEILEFRNVYGDYNLYQNMSAYQKCKNKKPLPGRDKRDNSEPFYGMQMMGRNPLGKDFLNQVDTLAARLPELLKVQEPELIFNFKFSTLEKIERILFRNAITDIFSDQIFLPLFAYYGKTFIRKNSKYDYDVKWTMRQNELYGFWVPDIQLNGHYLEVYDTILKMVDPAEDHRVGFGRVLSRYK